MYCFESQVVTDDSPHHLSEISFDILFFNEVDKNEKGIFMKAYSTEQRQSQICNSETTV